MRQIFHDHPMPEELTGAIAALGNFDGFHRGHQAVAGRAIELARERGVAALVATFDPHPVRYFKPDLPPFYLTRLDQRGELFEAAGADAMLVFRFDAEVASMAPDAFVRDMLSGQLGLGGVVTGQDIAFGRGRGGNAETLRTVGAEVGLISQTVSPILAGGENVSSSRIRSLLTEGRPEDAASLLTRPFTVRATVLHGAKEGRRLGMPTANMQMASYIRPKYGIYAVRGRLRDGRVVNGAANVGIRPSYDPPVEWLETHFFDIDEDLYGQEIDIEFHHFLRPELKFDDLDELVRQMNRDCDQARALLPEAEASISK